MDNKIKVLAISVTIIATMLSGCMTGPKDITTPEGKITIDEGRSGPDWCRAGTKITSSGPEGGQGSFEIKGITTHNSTEVCEAEYIYDQGSITHYFNEKGDYTIIVYKDKSGKIINEVKADMSYT